MSAGTSRPTHAEKSLVNLHIQPAESSPLPILSLLSDEEVAAILTVTVDWVRSHANEIPGLQRLGMYYRFHRVPLNEWLGNLEPLLNAEQVSAALKVPASWVYANADKISGFLRLGRYIRFRPAVFNSFIGGSEACQ
jgi:hypothetical protein